MTRRLFWVARLAVDLMLPAVASGAPKKSDQRIPPQMYGGMIPTLGSPALPGMQPIGVAVIDSGIQPSLECRLDLVQQQRYL